jgi:hypothetical protein
MGPGARGGSSWAGGALGERAGGWGAARNTSWPRGYGKRAASEELGEARTDSRMIGDLGRPWAVSPRN